MSRMISLVIALMIGLSGCATNSKQVVEDDGLKTTENIQGTIYITPIEDLTAGQALDQTIKQNIVETLNNKIISSRKYELAQSREDANFVLKIKIIQFTAGNRAARFWVGFGAGAAKLTFICELIDSKGIMVDQQKFQRFGAASLRSGDSIIQQMKELIVVYTSKWIKIAT